MKRALAVFALLLGCGSPEHHTGSGTIVGTVEGMNLASDHGVAIARMYPPLTQIKVSPSGVTCETVQAGDRVTFDIGAEKVGVYTVVVGYPNKALLSAAQARAHVCPVNDSSESQCHDQVRSGKVTITRFDGGEGGTIEGSYELELADGKISGTFSAYRCQ
jgi:hypothetical protein